jgi:hypothetical protein
MIFQWSGAYVIKMPQYFTAVFTFSRVKILRYITAVFEFTTMAQYYKTFKHGNLLPFYGNCHFNIV